MKPHRLLPLLVIWLVSCLPTTPTPTLITTAYHAYLPLVAKRSTTPMLCVENEAAQWPWIADKFNGECLKASAHWAIVARDGWGYVDSKVGDYTGPLFLSLKGAPAFITLDNTVCASIPENRWDAFISFAVEALERYPNTRYVELMNEPDTADPWASWWLGCWGDDYASGLYYGRFANYVAKTLHDIYPQIIIIGGAFIDPRYPFPDGALAVLSEVDAVSFHSYAHTFAASVALYDDKVAYLEARTSLPLMLTETQVLCPTVTPGCRQEQVAWVRWLIAHGGIIYNVGCHQDISDWNHTGLWDKECTITAAGEVYKER